MDLTDIERWNVDALDDMAKALSTRLDTLEEVQNQLRIIGELPGWEGEAADAARHKYTVSADTLTDEAATIGAVRHLTRSTADSVALLKTRLSTLHAEAAALDMQLQPDGRVTFRVDTWDSAENAKRRVQAQEIETIAQALILQAEDIDNDAAEVFNTIAHGQISTQGATTIDAASAHGEQQGALSAPAPPAQVTPAAAKAYWDCMTYTQQQEVLTKNPQWVGNLDGVPAAMRDVANRNRIPGERARLEKERDRLQAEVNNSIGHGTFTNEDAALTYTEKKLEDLAAIEKITKNQPDRKLLLLDLSSGERGMAAIAVGDPDTADHISVTTPGMDTTVAGSLEGMVKESDLLRKEALAQLENAHKEGETVSTISWIGYEPPVTTGPGNHDTPDWVPWIGEKDLGRGWADAVQTDKATAGGEKLASFYEGLAVTSTKDDPHITALGHSYGS
ncbi:MAG: alpha/beta hydrolase, partial [Mycobacteriaceae bacterium]